MAQQPDKPTLKTLADMIDLACEATTKQVAKERLEAEWKTKKRPTKAQREPVGLFEQTQETLFDQE